MPEQDVGADRMTGPPGRRRHPVFVSSTFREMDAERDLVNAVVIPAVNQRLAARGISLYPVDLRWGIDTTDLAEVEARQARILDVCIDEVERCRPLFVGLVGHRYGFVPPAPLQRRALARLGLDDEVGYPVSVLAVELLAACRAAADDGHPPILLRREGADADADPRLAPLLDHLARLGHDLTPYPPVTEGAVAGHPLVDLLVDRLEAAAAGLAAAPDDVDWLARELRLQRAHQAELAARVVGRRAELDGIADFCNPLRTVIAERDVGDDPNGPYGHRRLERLPRAMALLGPSGAGKSAVLARATAEMRATPPNPLADQLGAATVASVAVGLSPVTDHLAACLLLLVAQVDEGAARSVVAGREPSAVPLVEAVAAWSAAVTDERGGGRLFLLDGLDRLAPDDPGAMTFGWLPDVPPAFNRIVVSAATDSTAGMVLGRRRAWGVVDLDELPVDDALALAAARIDAAHRRLPPALVTLLVRRSRSPRWLVVAADLLLTLSVHDYRRAEAIAAERGVAAEEALARMLAETVAGLPSDLVELHTEVYDRLLDVFDEKVVVVLAMLGATIHGLRPDDLVAMSELVGRPLLPADLALLRSILAEHVLVDRGTWSFAHLASAVAAVELLEHDPRGGYPRLVAAHLVRLPVADPVRGAELVPALLRAGDHEAVVRLLARPDQLDDTGRASVGIGLLAAAAEGEDALVDVVGSLLDVAARPEEVVAVSELVVGLLPTVSRPTARRLADVTRPAVAALPPATTSREGATTEELAALVDVLAHDPSRPDEASVPARVGRWRAALVEDGAGLADAPDLLGGAVAGLDAVVAVEAELEMLTAYGLAVGSGIATEAPGDRERARDRLRAAQAVLADARRRRPAGWEGFELAEAIARRALDSTWPDAGFAPDPDDLDRARARTDGVGATIDVVCQYAVLARSRALTIAGPVMDETEPGQDAIEAAEAAAFDLQCALDRLAAELLVFPESLAVETEWLAGTAFLGQLHMAFEQHASACRCFMAVADRPRAEAILGWEQLSYVVTGALLTWLGTLTQVAPTPGIEALLRGVEAHGEPAWGAEPDMPWAMAELAMLGAALQWQQRSGEHELARRVVERALDLEPTGLLDAAADPGEELSVVQMVVETLVETEEGLVEDVLEMAADGELGELRSELRDAPEVLAHLAGAEEVRDLVEARRGPVPELWPGRAVVAAVLSFVDPADTGRRRRAEEALARLGSGAPSAGGTPADRAARILLAAR